MISSVRATSFTSLLMIQDLETPGKGNYFIRIFCFCRTIVYYVSSLRAKCYECGLIRYRTEYCLKKRHMNFREYPVGLKLVLLIR